MSKEKTNTISKGDKTKKFKMPKFPPALVIIFCVLLVAVLLSWIPHKGWVDTKNPLFYFNEVGIFGPNSAFPLATWKGDQDWDLFIEGNSQLTLELTEYGVTWIMETLMIKYPAHDFSSTFLDKLIGLEIIISGLNKGDDWSKATINYSSLSFWVGTNEGNIIFVEFDKVFVPNQMMETTEAFTFNVLSVIINENKNLSFSSGNVASNWFNFFDTNYYVGDTAGRYGILNLPFLIIAGVFNAANLILFVLCIGAFIKVMLESGALEAGTISLVKKLEGKELLLIPTIYFLCAFVGTAAGMTAAMIGLIPLIVPFLVFAGFDTMTGLMVVVIGNMSGVASSVLDLFSVGVMSGALNTPGPTSQIGVDTGIVLRIILFLAFITAGMSYCTWYANRSRKGKDYVMEPEVYEQNKEWAEEMLGEAHATYSGITKKQLLGLIIFAGTFIVMLFALLPWTTWFEGLNSADWWAAISSIFFAKVLLGDWYFMQLALLFFISSLIIGRVFGMKQKQTNKAIIKGARGMFGVAMIMALTRSISLVLTYSGLTTSMIAMMFAGASGGQFSPVGLAWILFPIMFILSLFIPSTSGLAGVTGPLLGPIIWQLSAGYSDPEAMFVIFAIIVMSTYTLAEGTAQMCMPTSGMLVAEVELSRVNFGRAFKVLGTAALGIMIIGMVMISISIPIMMSNSGL